MARPRNPLLKATAEGRNVTHPSRYEKRKEPKVAAPLGPPPKWLVDTDVTKAKAAWMLFQREIPWLNETHRSFLEIAANIRGRLMTGQEVGVQALNLLRQCLGQMGATPADATKVSFPDGEEEKDDLVD